MGCNIVLIDESTYRKEYPPIAHRGKKTKLNIGVKIDILTLGDFEEIKLSYRAKLELTLKWFDERLKYANLKDDLFKNMIRQNDTSSIWIPPIVFNNSETSTRISPNIHPSIFVHKLGPPTTALPSILDETYFYAGSANMLVLISEFDTMYSCKFSLGCYPFDTQICTIEVKKEIQTLFVLLY